MDAVEDFMLVEKDNESILVFFYCDLCPLSVPFLEETNAKSYRDGHKHNRYHKRRLELQQ